MLVDIAAYLEHDQDLVQEIAEVAGDEMTALNIARCIRSSLFMTDGNTWREDVRRRTMAAVFVHCV